MIYPASAIPSKNAGWPATNDYRYEHNNCVKASATRWPAMHAMTFRANATSATMPEMRVEEPRQADAMAKLSHPGVAFTDFVQVKLIEEIGFTVATSERFDAYGAGDDVSSALAELASMLVDEYQELSNSDMPLSTHLRLKLQALSALIRPA